MKLKFTHSRFKNRYDQSLYDKNYKFVGEIILKYSLIVSLILKQILLTSTKINFSCDFIAQRYMNVNKVEMSQYFSKELEEVIFSLGMKKMTLPMVPNGLIAHPEYGDIISKIVSPLKSVKKLVSSTFKYARSAT